MMTNRTLPLTSPERKLFYEVSAEKLTERVTSTARVSVVGRTEEGHTQRLYRDDFAADFQQTILSHLSRQYRERDEGLAPTRLSGRDTSKSAGPSLGVGHRPHPLRLP